MWIGFLGLAILIVLIVLYAVVVSNDGIYLEMGITWIVATVLAGALCLLVTGILVHGFNAKAPVEQESQEPGEQESIAPVGPESQVAGPTDGL